MRQRGAVLDARRTDVVLLLVAIVWGSSYLAAKTATVALPVLVVLFARYAISALACGPLVATRRPTREEARVGALLGVTQAAILVRLAAAVVRAGHVALVGRLTAHRPVRPLQLTAVQTAVGTAAVAVGLSLGGERLTVPAALGAALLVAGTYWGQAVERAHRTTEKDTRDDDPCPTTSTTPTAA